MAGSRKVVLLVIAAILVTAMVGGAVAWVSATRSPAYSLRQLATAIQDKNWDGVQKYVDLDSVESQAFDAALRDSTKSDASGLSGGLAASAALPMKPTFVQNAKETFKKSIEQGPVDGSSSPFANYLGGKTVTSVTYIGNDEALVTVAVTPEGKPSYDVKLKMKRLDDFWRVTAIDNILDLPTE